MIKRYVVYRIIDLGNGFNTHEFEFQDYFDTEDQAVDFIRKANEITDGFYIVLPFYSN